MKNQIKVEWVTLPNILALLTALGVGTMLKSVLDKVMGRESEKIDIVEKTVKLVDFQLDRLAERQGALERELSKGGDLIKKLEQKNKDVLHENESMRDSVRKTDIALSRSESLRVRLEERFNIAIDRLKRNRIQYDDI